MLFDAHFHYPVCSLQNVLGYDNLDFNNYSSLSASHSFSEWEIQRSSPKNIYHAFGIHPELIGKLSDEEINAYKAFLKEKAENGELDAIGEAGFDFFTSVFKESKEKQEEIFLYEVELCIKYNLPLVIHCRKANDKLFLYSSSLKKVQSVLFHSFMGSLVEANSLIKRGINCFFSFGKQMINNNKKVIECVTSLPLDNLLLETDAPFQTLKGETYTYASEIQMIYKEAYKLRNKNSDFNLGYKEFENAIYNNAKRFLSVL